jgi:hypothetical protein
MMVTVATGVRLANTRERKRQNVKLARQTNILRMVLHATGANLVFMRILWVMGLFGAYYARKENIRMRHHRIRTALIVRMAR